MIFMESLSLNFSFLFLTFVLMAFILIERLGIGSVSHLRQSDH